MTPKDEEMLALAERCESAVGPNDILDHDINAATVRDDWPAPYTRSLDAALSLVPEGWRWFIDCVDGPNVCLWHRERKLDGVGLPYQERATGTAATPALALCAAALRTRTTGDDTMSDLFYFLWGLAMAGLVGYGGASVFYREYKFGVPSLLAGLTLYAALWFTIP